jgi:hypothetical protein
MDLSSLFSKKKAPAPRPAMTMQALDEVLAKVKHSKDDEWQRIIDIPRVSAENDVSPRDVEWLHKGTARLRPIQALALALIQKRRGFYGSIGVGHGKSLIGYLAPVVLGSKQPLIMMPPDLIEPYKADLERFKDHFQKPSPEPLILSYNALSSKKESDVLDRLRPDLIVADEGHTLANDSARTRRFRRYFEKNPECVFVLLSGSLERPEMSDLAHLVHYALRDNAFMPVRGAALDVWGQCVDIGGKPNENHWRTFAPLATAEGMDIDDTRGRERTSIARDAVYLRMSTTPGVLLTTENSCDVPLYAERVKSLVMPPDLIEVLDRIRTGEETPDGEDIIADDAQRARLQRNLSMGFYYRWAWEKVGGRDEEWLMARKTWNRCVRRELENHAREFYDSESLVFDVTARELLEDPRLEHRSLRHMAFADWRRQKEKLKPPTEPVWLSDHVFEWLAEWLKDRPPTLIWYTSDAIEERLAKMNIPVYGAGSLPPTKVEHCAVSISVHHKGKNLQAWASNLVLEPFSKPDRNQQLIGRTRRPGQLSNRIYIGYLAHTSVLDSIIDKALEKSEHVQDLSRSPQHLLEAKWSAS